MGAVGEVAIGWSQTPNMVISTNPTHYDSGVDWGILRARETRPTELLNIGPVQIPLAINSYTSALPDWPSRVLYQLIPDPNILKLWHITMGAMLLILVARLFQKRIAIPMMLLLATDWSFLIYKHLLGATEICLQLASIGLIWTIYHRKDWGWFIFCTLLGIQAKLTFIFVAIPTFLCILIFRVKLPKQKIALGLGIGLLLLLPLILAAIHHSQVSSQVQSHDGFGMQWNRITQALQFRNTPALREQTSNLIAWLVDPISFYERIYKRPHPHLYTRGLRILGWICLGLCLIKNRKNTTMWMWTAIFAIQAISISLGPKDLHHFAMIVPTFALWMSMVISGQKRMILWLCPFVVSSILFNFNTDGLYKKIDTPTFTQSKQQALITLLEHHKVQRLLTMDYEIYGVLEYHQSNIDIIHGWPAISHQRYRALPHLLEERGEGHVIVLKASMPMRYNLRPNKNQLETAAKKRGLLIEDLMESKDISIYRIYNPATELP